MNNFYHLFGIKCINCKSIIQYSANFDVLLFEPINVTIELHMNALTIHFSEIEKFQVLIDNSVNIIISIKLSERAPSQIMLSEPSANIEPLDNT